MEMVWTESIFYCVMGYLKRDLDPVAGVKGSCEPPRTPFALFGSGKVLARINAGPLQQASPPENGAIVWDFIDSRLTTFTVGSASATSAYTRPIYIDQGAGLVTLFASSPVSFNLQAPNGSLITPISAASDPNIQYGQLDEIFTSGTGWTQQYALVNQPAGIYTAVVNSLTDTSFTLLAQMSSTVELDHQTQKPRYLPNETVVLTATLRNMPAASTVMSGNLFLADGTAQAISFSDGGTNGDAAANDGIFTSQFAVPTVTYYPAASNPYVRYEIQAQANDLSRLAQGTITVLPDTASIIGATGSFTTDEDADGLINSLGITLSLQVTHTGEFQLNGLLTDLSGASVVGQAILPSGRVLNSGTNSVALVFDGINIRRSNVNGPYRLSVVFLQDNNSAGIGLQTISNVYTTSPYSVTQFEQPPLNIVSATHRLVDSNNNGLANSLEIVVQPQGLTPGYYQVSGDLVDENGTTISLYDDSPLLTADQPLTFTFPGGDIVHAFVSGPYRLTNLVIARYNYGGDPKANLLPVSFFDDVHTTEAYSPTQFEGVLTTLSPYAPVCTPLNRTVWVASTSLNTASSGLAVDGITTTVWNSGVSQLPTHTFGLDMGNRPRLMACNWMPPATYITTCAATMCKCRLMG
ncbi:MAG: hypothetical protein HC853_01545 [Anaerolineae bacterium]|nr:hypothetical protein [Anaerolineae bacterium]